MFTTFLFLTVMVIRWPPRKYIVWTGIWRDFNDFWDYWLNEPQKIRKCIIRYITIENRKKNKYIKSPAALRTTYPFCFKNIKFSIHSSFFQPPFYSSCFVSHLTELFCFWGVHFTIEVSTLTGLIRSRF